MATSESACNDRLLKCHSLQRYSLEKEKQEGKLT